MAQSTSRVVAAAPVPRVTAFSTSVVPRALPSITTIGNGTIITLNGTNAGTTTYGIIASDITTQADFIQAGGAVALNSTQDISLTKTNINFTGSNSPSVTLDTNYTSATPINGAIALTNSNDHHERRQYYVGQRNWPRHHRHGG